MMLREVQLIKLIRVCLPVAENILMELVVEVKAMSAACVL